MFEDAEKRPEVFSTTNIVLAAVVHLVFFGICSFVAACTFTPKETVIPIDLTLVVHENLDGNDDEPPPPEPPKPQPPEPKPQSKVETPPPPPVQKPPDALVKVNDEKKKPDKPKVEEKKKEEPKKPEKPKETREERIKRMRERAKVVNEPPPKPTTNGRTGRKTLSDAEIAKRLSQGYKPGRTEQLASGEEQRCVSLIYQAFYDKWEAPAYSSSLHEIELTVTFDMNGRVVNWRITKGSGDASADATVKRAAALVKQVYGLTESFLRANKVITVRFTVKPQ